MRGEVEKVREMEVRKAIGGLAGKKAAGLDGLVAEVFQKYLLRNNEPFLFYCRVPPYAR